MEQIEQISTSNVPNKVNKIRKSSDETLKNLFETGKWSNLTVTLNAKDYSIHQFIVCPVIPFFDSMMSSNFKESHENRVTINHPINNETFEWLIQWAYSFEKEINLKNVKDLLVASDYLQVEEVFHACCVYLGEILNVKTALSIKEWISPFDVGKLAGKVAVYILNNFDEISKTEKWLSLSVECLTRYIKDDDNVGFYEHEILRAILDWTEYDPDSRRKHLSSLLRLIIWNDINPMYIFDQITTCELIKNDEDCRKLLEDVLRFKAFPDPNHPMFDSWKRKRNHKYHGEALMAFKKSTNDLFCYVKTPYTKDWRLWESFGNLDIELSDEPQIHATDKFLYIHSEKEGNSTDIFVELLSKATSYVVTTSHPKNVTSSSNKIYIAESSENSEETIKVKSIEDFKSGVWNDLFSFNTNSTNFGMVYLNDFLYFIGGRPGNLGPTSAVTKRYNILESKWEILPPMSIPRFNPKVITLDDKIYVYGGPKPRFGARAKKILKSFESYNPKQAKWCRIPAPECDPEFLVPFNSKLYVFSDRNLNEVNIYHPKTDKWTLCKRSGFPDDIISVISVPNLQTL